MCNKLVINKGKLDKLSITKIKDWSIYFTYEDKRYMLHEDSEGYYGYWNLYERIFDKDNNLIKVEFIASCDFMESVNDVIKYYRHKIVYKHIDKEYFVSQLNELCECVEVIDDNFEVIEPTEKDRVYNGWEIIKMISEGKLGKNEEDWIYNVNDGSYYNTHDIITDTELITVEELIKDKFKVCKVLTIDEVVKEIRKGTIESIITLDYINGYLGISYKNVTNDTLTKMNMDIDKWIVVYK